MAIGLDEAHRFDSASRLNDAFAEQGIDLDGVTLDDLVVERQHGELVVGLGEAGDADQPIRDLPHASLDTYVAGAEAAMLYLDGEGHNLPEPLERTGGGGDDRLIGGAGRDHLDGGSGEDTADYGESDAGVAIDLGSGRTAGGHASGDTLVDVQTVPRALQRRAAPNDVVLQSHAA